MSEKVVKYKCRPCGYVYDPQVGVPEYGINPGINFEDLPEDWTCPKCAASRWMFEKTE
ncbi:rubredoxin [Peptostreptococcus equinus]|uniref:Rubredoxin n=1 Tax=Peptostreptococcus equinus TaxID=3003601 RepID=A0ABY7JTR8_9FIRM|nr:rubredoxin [Peptostreptococcus sp. CBA3647]WAW15548.1 rubredoxin [Peptostreptococcus sp. CBA3647]